MSGELDGGSLFAKSVNTPLLIWPLVKMVVSLNCHRYDVDTHSIGVSIREYLDQMVPCLHLWKIFYYLN